MRLATSINLTCTFTNNAKVRHSEEYHNQYLPPIPGTLEPLLYDAEP